MIMIEVHKFTTLLAAWTALAQINASQGFPTSDGQTATYTSVSNDGTNIYILADAITKGILETETEMIEVPDEII